MYQWYQLNYNGGRCFVPLNYKYAVYPWISAQGVNLNISHL